MTIDLEREKKTLLDMHAMDRAAHFATDAEDAVSRLSDEQIIVREGTIRHMSRDAVRAITAEYFSGATFHEWDDVEPPIIRVSDDASIAWMINQTRVRLTRKDAEGNDSEVAFVYAGILTFEKKDGAWQRTANVSTFAIGEE
ncbi:hypothetical protein ACFLSZ_06340 [Candidatus Bipolaricaulota bacterium]